MEVKQSLPKRATAMEAVEGTTHYLIRTMGFGGTWGRGETVEEAVRNAHMYSQDKCYIVRTDVKGRCDEIHGNMSYDVRGPIYEGVVMASRKEVRITGKYKD